MTDTARALKLLDGRVFKHGGRTYVLRNGLPVPAGNDVITAEPGVRWISLPDASRISGRPRSSVSLAIRKGHLRASRLDLRIARTPSIFVCYEDVIAWTRSFPLHPRQRAHSAEMEGRICATPEACLRYLLSKRKAKHAESVRKKQRRRARR